MKIFDFDDQADPGWSDDWPTEDWVSDSTNAVSGLRLVLSEDYTDATDAEMAEALEQVMDTMSPAESFNFGSALNQIARTAGQALSDPTVASIAKTALPIAGGALGTVIGGPVGTALGGQLGTIAANALPARRPADPAAAPSRPITRVSVPGPTGAAPAPPAASAPAAGIPASAAGGSVAAAQGLVLAAHPLMQQALASAAFGQHGQPQVGGIPVASLLGLLSQVVGQAAAEADELLYQSSDGSPSEFWDGEDEGWSDTNYQDLYTSIIDAGNLELAESMDLAEYLP